MVGHISPDPVYRMFYQVWCNAMFGPGKLAATDLADGVVLVLGQALPTVVACCWLLSPLGGLRELMAKGSDGC